jgi:hypothetical protein
MLYIIILLYYIYWVTYLIHQKKDPDLFSYMKDKMDWLMKNIFKSYLDPLWIRFKTINHNTPLQTVKRG